MDALLIAPPEARYVRAFATTEYLGVAYLASYLEHHDINVEIHNCNCRTASSISEAVQQAVVRKPPVVGISVPTLPNLPGAVHAVQELRNAGYAGHITMGGHVPTFQYPELLQSLSGLSSVVRGEGEQTLLELVKTCTSGSDWKHINGIAYMDHEDVVVTQPRSLISNLDALPFPKRTLSNVDEKKATRIAEVCSSRGCYGNCTFCSIYSFYSLAGGPRFRCRSAENVVDELVQLVNDNGIRTVIFVDDNFLGTGRVGKERAARIAELILQKELDLAFNISCRVNDIDADLFALLKHAGLSRVFVGVESGVQSALDRYRKHVRVEQNLKALSVLNDLNIKWDMGFIIYDPDTTFEELQENVEFLRSNRLYLFKAATLLLNGMVIFPGTPVETQLACEGRLERRISDALEFMGAHNDVTDYDQALRFVNQTYSLRDGAAARMRQMIDLAYELLTPLYDAIWPLVTDWEKWLDIAVKTTAIEPKRILELLGERREVYQALLHWQEQIGVLVMNLLEDMVELVKNGKDLTAFNDVLKRRVHNYLERGHALGFAKVIEEAEDFLSADSVTLILNNRVCVIPGATAAQWTEQESRVQPFSFTDTTPDHSDSGRKEVVQ